MTLKQFIDKWLGNKADYDGYFGGQCVDLYRFYVKEVLALKQSPGVGGASEIWHSADHNLYNFIKYEHLITRNKDKISFLSLKKPLKIGNFFKCVFNLLS